MDYFNTHLCGSEYREEGRCEHLVYANKDDMTVGNKKLQKYYLYCTAEGKCRSLGCSASWTGNSPTWCPKRKALNAATERDEAQENNVQD